jgi:hypothetical protein
MKCPNHPDRDVLSFCHNCGEHLCRECLVDGGDYFYCKKTECQQILSDNPPKTELNEIHEKIDDLIHFTSVSSPLDAQLIKMRLEAEGVRCFIFD